MIQWKIYMRILYSENVPCNNSLYEVVQCTVTNGNKDKASI